jgi:hypothetical protein
LLVGEAARIDLGTQVEIRIEQHFRLLELARYLDEVSRNCDNGARRSHAASGATE